MRLAPSTIRNTVDRIKAFLRNSDGVVSYESVSNHLKNYLNHAPATYNAELRSIRRLMKYLNVEDLTQSFKYAPMDMLPQEPPSNHQVRQGFEAQTDTLSRAVYLFTASTGLRRGEIFDLHKERIDWDTRAVTPTIIQEAREMGSHSTTKKLRLG